MKDGSCLERLVNKLFIALLARLSLIEPPTPLRNDYMKVRINFGHVLVVALGVNLSLANTMSAGERPKSTHAEGHSAGALSGQLTGTFGNQIVYGAGETVTLTPLFGSGGQALTIKTDSEGRYAFGALLPGEYELKTQLNWTTTYIEVSDDGSTDRMYADHWKQLVARVLVKAGRTAHVTTFSEGETRNAFYAYGGTLSRPHHTLVTCD